MISLEDCIAMCELDRAEVDAIAEHEHLPEIAAAALARYLMQKAGGEKEIRRMLVDDIRAALEHKRIDHAADLLGALRHFLSEHPAATADLVDT